MTEPSPIDLSGSLQLSLAFVGLLAGFGFAAAMQHFATWLQLDREAKTGLARVHHAVELLKRRFESSSDDLDDLLALVKSHLRDATSSPAEPTVRQVGRVLRRLEVPDQRISAVVLNLVLQTAFDRNDPVGAEKIVDARTAWQSLLDLNVEGIARELVEDFPAKRRDALDPVSLTNLQKEAREAAGSAQNARRLWYLMFGTFLLSGILMIVGLTLLRHGLDRGVLLSADSRALLRGVISGFSFCLGLTLLGAAAIMGCQAGRKVWPPRSRPITVIACDPFDDHWKFVVLDVVLAGLFLACIYGIGVIEPS